MTPDEFDAAVRTLRRRCPALSVTSAGRSVERNARVGGSPDSKHLIDMAVDLVGPHEAMRQGAAIARILGLWWDIHGDRPNTHLHVQGLPPGAVPEWWTSKFDRRD